MASRSSSIRGGFYIKVAAPQNIRYTDENNRFTSQGQKDLYAENRQLAQILQAQVVENIEASYKRPGVTTGRLIRATADPKNRKSDRFLLAVGDPLFLNKSIAKYWRTIEEGSKVTWTKRSFTSLPLQGFWSHDLGEWHMGPSGPWVSARPPFNRFPGGMFQPLRKGRGGDPAGVPTYYPKHDIAPMNAYKRAFEDPRLLKANLDNAIKLLKSSTVLPAGFFDL